MGLFSRKQVETQERNTTPENNEPLSDLLLSCFLNGEKLTREKVLTIPAVCGQCGRKNRSDRPGGRHHMPGTYRWSYSHRKLYADTA